MTVRILSGDCRVLLAGLSDASVQTCVTSPPYFGLRDYGHAGQIGLEPTPDAYVAELVAVFRDVKRVLRDDGTLWLNLGDSYAGTGYGANTGNFSQRNIAMRQKTPCVDGVKPKDLWGIPWRVAFALQADGWYLRSDIIWHKPNPSPERFLDRPTKTHEYVFLLSASGRYYYDSRAIAGIALDDGRPVNAKSVWTVPTMPFKGAHFATFPPALIEPCILAGSKRGDTVLDPFGGAGTTGLVADRLGRDAVLCELNAAYAAMATNRIQSDGGMLSEVVNA